VSRRVRRVIWAKLALQDYWMVQRWGEWGLAGLAAWLLFQ